MENSALNLAHQQHRRAEKLLRTGHFEDAVQCHQAAAELLQEAMSTTKVERSLESLRLQHEYHKQQLNIVRLKKVQFEKYQKAVENQRLKMALQSQKKVLEKQEEAAAKEQEENIQLEIFRRMDEADSLLQLLIPEQSQSTVLPVEEEEVEQIKAKEVAVKRVEGLKHPKNDTTVIEEMRIVNQQLRSLVSQLLTQLEEYSRENKGLRQRVQGLELALANQRTESDIDRRGGLRVITDSGSSPFVFSPCSELSPDSNFSMNRELPPLAPLEMPNFDFSVFKMKSADSDEK